MDMSWLHAFFEWISSIIIQIPYYYEYAINLTAYGDAGRFSFEFTDYPVFETSAIVVFYSVFFMLWMFTDKGKLLGLGIKFWYLLKGKSLGKRPLSIFDFLLPILPYLFFSWRIPPGTLHDLTLKISSTLIVFHTVLFLVCVILENRRSKERKQEESHSDVVLVSAQ